jgi:hypothetical protein
MQAAIESIVSKSRHTLTMYAVPNEQRARGTDLADGASRTRITSEMNGDSPDHRGTTDDDLKRIDRGVYRLRQGG